MSHDGKRKHMYLVLWEEPYSLHKVAEEAWQLRKTFKNSDTKERRTEGLVHRYVIAR